MTATPLPTPNVERTSTDDETALPPRGTVPSSRVRRPMRTGLLAVALGAALALAAGVGDLAWHVAWHIVHTPGGPTGGGG